jgi:hypothetical protein
VALRPQAPPVARRACHQRDPTIAGIARDTPAVCQEHRSDATPGLLMAPAALPVGERSGAQGKARRELRRLGRIVVAGAAQAQWIVIGIEV